MNAPIMESTDFFLRSCFRYARWACVAAAALACAALAGFWLDAPILAGGFSASIPMAPNTAAAFLCLAAALHPGLPWRRSRRVQVYLAAAVLVLAAPTVLRFLTQAWLRSTPAPPVDSWRMIWTMSPVTGACFLALGAAVMLQPAPGSKMLSAAARTGAAAVLATSFIMLLGYIYDQPFFYGASIVPMALTTAVCFLCVSSAFFIIGGPSPWPLHLLAGQAPSARIMRRTLPLLAGIYLLEGFVESRFVMPALTHDILTLAGLTAMAGSILLISRRLDVSIAAAQASLRESQLFIEGIINAIPVRVFWKNRDLVFLGCNAIFARDAGFESAKDIIGKDDYQMGWRDQADLYRGDDRQVIESGRPKLLIEEPQTTPQGDTLFLLTSKIPLRGNDGKIIGILGTYMDITERKKAEAVMVNMQKLESLGTLAGGIAHDFNNILTAILGNLSLLQSQLQDGDAALNLIQEAQEACGTAKGLSHQLLTFAKGGSPVVQVMDLRPLLSQAAGFAARGSDSRCVFDLGDSPLAVNIDKDQVAQVVQNLVINAAQAMPSSGNITVRAAIVTLSGGELPPLAAGRYVWATVEDQGAGIPAAHLSKIFDPYFSTKAKGRGLGLSVCHSIMAKHGGHISVESKPGQGAAFTLHFPAANAADIPLKQKRPPLAAGSGRVLIMDDEPMVSKALTRMLERLGCHSECAGDGKTALDAYRRALEAGKPFDAVIMDLTIPGGMGGKEAIGKLLALDPKAKAIVSSGYSMDPVMSNYAADGFCGALKKPYRIGDVSEVLRKIIGAKPGG
ncbi:MAG: hypothetical protein A3G41_07665 [Elusimicrobia bacterium RIFCSPLOWO2_12_FULL_59_9]|nr:MAG: hypothetical protein A3G41_07665 [Elusimicrobia bacterium RIFCSPLOWO2_12_FULL_59_9]